MSSPNVSLTIRDPGLGIVPANAGRVQVKLGACSKAVPAVLQGFGSVNAAKAALKGGPLLDAVVQALDVAGGPVLAMPVSVASPGAFTGALTLTGSGTGTVTGSTGPQEVIKVKIILGGSPGTMTFQVAIGAGAYGPTITSGAATYNYQVPGDYFTTLKFAAGTYIANDVYTVGVNGLVVLTGTGPATALNTSTFSPVDGYNVKVLVTIAGGLGVGSFKYALDGQADTPTYSASLGIPAGGVYVVPDTGIVLTFSGTFVAADVYAAASTPPGFTTTEVNTALTALFADPTDWGFFHLVGTPADAAAADAMAVVLDAQLSVAETTLFRYVFGILECSQVQAQSTIKTAFAAFTSARVCVCVGDVDLFSRLTGRTDKRNLAWALSARLSSIKLSEDPAKVRLGRMKNVVKIYLDETALPGLDDARFTTMRTLTGKIGYYLNNFRLMAAPGSDFTYGMNRRVMDRLCQLSRSAYLDYLNDDVRIDKTTGYIDVGDAQVIDSVVTSSCETGLAGECSGVTTQIGRADDVLRTSTESAEVGCIPKGYLKQINVTVGFINPASQAATT